SFREFFAPPIKPTDEAAMLTRKKRLYADHREKGLGPRDAAVEAGYSQKYAKQCGYKLDRDPDVIRYREKLAARAGQPAGAAEPAGMDAVARVTEFIERTLGEPGLSDAEAARRVLRAQLHSDDERVAQNAA